MTTTLSATEIWLIGNSNRDLNTSCLPTNADGLHYFFHMFKNQNDTTNAAVKRTIEAATEIRNPYVESSWLHSNQLLKIFEWWKKSIIVEKIFGE